MKFSVRQILASAAGAVIAAVIASVFGVKGTIIGVAIGSAVATLGTALVAQSIERGQEAVKQVVVRAPESSTLLRKLGATGTGGDAASSVDASSAPTETGPTAGAGAETVEMESTAAPVGATERLEISAAADAPRTEHLDATTLPMQPAGGRARRFSWPAIAGTAAIVFVLALMFITAIELISGKPLASIFGNAGTGTSLNNSPPPATTTTTTTTTMTTSSTTTTTTNTSTTSSTTTTPTSTTTSTTAPPRSSTTTTAPGASTTTTGVGVTTTTAAKTPGATSP